MGFSRRSRCFYKTGLVALLFWGAATGSIAQGDETGLVYKFQLQGVNDPAIAKPIQYALMEESEVISCIYINECACLRLNTAHDYDQASFFHLLHDLGVEVVGPVMVSDGRVFEVIPQAPINRQ